MLRLALVGTVLGAVLGQSVSPDALDWPALLGGALGSSPPAAILAWRLARADRELSAARRENREMHAETLKMVEKMAPLLADSARALAETEASMKATLRESRPSDPGHVLRRLEQVVTDLEGRR